MSLELFFKTPSAFNDWLAKNHDSCQELWVCYYKKHTGRQTITWEESVEEALCYGWIDGLKHSINEEAYKIRFTPRRKNSIWSPTNLATIQRLIKEKRIKKPGLSIYNQRKPEHSKVYENIRKDFKLDKSYVLQLKANKEAWETYTGLAPGMKKQVNRWIMTAKKEETRDRRFARLIEFSSKGELIPALRWSKKK